MDDEIQINIILEKDTELNKEKIVDDKINIFKDLDSKLNILEKNIENKEKYEKSQNSLVDLYENISKLKQNLIQTQEELIKEKTELLNEKNENSFEIELENMQKNINILNQKFEEEKNKNLELTEKYNEKNEENKKLKKIIEEINIKYEDKIREKNNEIETKKKEIEKYKSESTQNVKELKGIKEELYKDYENKLQEELKKIKENFSQQVKEFIEKMKDKYKKEFQKKEKEYNTKFNELKYLIEEPKLNKDNDSDSDSDFDDNDNDNDSDDTNNIINNEIHINKNEIEKEKEIKNEIIEKMPEYSYECINKKDLEINIDGIRDFSNFEIKLKNNGNKTWHKDSKLKRIGPSNSVAEIILDPQEPEKIGIYKINFNYLEKKENGEYRVYLEFYSNGNNYGERLEIKVNINKNEEIIKNIDKIKTIRKDLGLSEEEYPNEKILRYIKDNNNDTESIFDSMFNQNNSN